MKALIVEVVEKLKNPKVAIPSAIVAALLVLGLVFTLFWSRGERVAYGTRVVCKACRRLIKDNTKTKIVSEDAAYRYSITTRKALCKECKEKKAIRDRRRKQREEEFLAWLAAMKGRSNQSIASGGQPPLTSLDKSTTIRVGVYSTPSSGVALTATGSFSVLDSSGRQVASLGRGQTVTFSNASGLCRLSGPGLSGVYSSARLVPQGGATAQVVNMSKYNQFRGALEVRYSGFSHQLWVINEVSLYDYLNGIGEEPETWSGMPSQRYNEFLKAAAVALRTYALAVKHEGKHNRREPFDICSFTSYQSYGGCCQLYIGYVRETHGNNLREAIEATSGQVATYRGQIIRAPYFSGCDGRTRSWQEVWGGSGKPWAVSVPCPSDAGNRKIAHGVGMCMRGARWRANQGASYKDILSYYYRGTTVETR